MKQLTSQYNDRRKAETAKWQKQAQLPFTWKLRP
jgi:hypothetical protein